MVLHNLRNGLATIQGYALLILEDELKPSELKEYASIINRRTIDLNRITSAINDLTRDFQNFRSPPTPLQKVFERWVQNSVFAQHIEFQVELCENFSIPLSADRIKMIFNELASNVELFCPAPRVVTIRGEDNVLRWSDNGIGISESFLEKIATPFHSQANRFCQSPGLGLGLAHCKRLVEEADGSFEVKTSNTGLTSIMNFKKNPNKN